LYLGRLKGGPAALPPPLLPLRPVLATAPKRSRCARRPACRCVAIHRAHSYHAPCAHPSPSPAVPFHAFVMFFFFWTTVARTQRRFTCMYKRFTYLIVGSLHLFLARG
jgi:hypothetical protein